MVLRTFTIQNLSNTVLNMFDKISKTFEHLTNLNLLILALKPKLTELQVEATI